MVRLPYDLVERVDRIAALDSTSRNAIIVEGTRAVVRVREARRDAR